MPYSKALKSNASLSNWKGNVVRNPLIRFVRKFDSRSRKIPVKSFERMMPVEREEKKSTGRILNVSTWRKSSDSRLMTTPEISLPKQSKSSNSRSVQHALHNPAFDKTSWDVKQVDLPKLDNLSFSLPSTKHNFNVDDASRQTLALVGTTPEKATKTWKTKVAGESLVKGTPNSLTVLNRKENSFTSDIVNSSSIVSNIGSADNSKNRTGIFMSSKEVVSTLPKISSKETPGGETSGLKPRENYLGTNEKGEEGRLAITVRLPEEKDASNKESSIKDTSSILADQSVSLITSTGTQAITKSSADSPDFHAVLLKFYQDNNPSKVGEVGKLIIKHKGKEEVLFEKLARKYKVSNPLHAPKVTHPNNDEDKQKKSFFAESNNEVNTSSFQNKTEPVTSSQSSFTGASQSKASFDTSTTTKNAKDLNSSPFPNISNPAALQSPFANTPEASTNQSSFDKKSSTSAPNSTMFGKSLVSNVSQSPFGKNSTSVISSPSPFGSKGVPSPSPFGVASTAASFGAQATTSPSPFVTAPSPSPFVGAQMKAASSPFSATPTAAPSAFGAANQSPFGATSPHNSFGASTSTSSSFSSNAGANSVTFGGRPTREIVVAFYQKYNPSKMAEIDKVLTKYAGKEEQLLRNLAKKYNVDPTFLGISNSMLATQPSGGSFGSNPANSFGQANSGFGNSMNPSSTPFGASTSPMGGMSGFGKPSGLSGNAPALGGLPSGSSTFASVSGTGFGSLASNSDKSASSFGGGGFGGGMNSSSGGNNTFASATPGTFGGFGGGGNFGSSGGGFGSATFSAAPFGSARR